MDNLREYIYNLATDRKKGKIAAIIKFFLFLFSFIYGAAVRILILAYSLRAQRINCKVISVGNITLGGTGKTTLAEFIARYLSRQGHKVAILSRGYKRKFASSQVRKFASYETMGDEPYMLKKNLEGVAVIVNADRLAAAKTAIRDYNADTVILDDGLQQWKLKKDLEIVTIDATNPFGNRHLLPRGLLRQPLSSLEYTDMFVLTKADLAITGTPRIKDALMKLNPLSTIVESIHQPLGFYNIASPQQFLDTASLKGKSVTLFSGIGDPGSFEALIENCGVKAGLAFRFSDHHNYTQQDLDKIVRDSQQKGLDTIITTQKDASRIAKLLKLPAKPLILVLRIALKITKNEKGFYNRLLGLYSR